MKLFIVRHGETESNNDDLLQGQLDGVLSERGRQQAQALAEALRKETFDAIYSSDLRRGRETVEIIAAALPPPAQGIHFLKEVRERGFGVYEGTNRTAFYSRERALPEPHTHRPDKGESFADLYERARRFLSILVDRHPEGTVLVVSHGDFARMCLGLLTGKSVQEACRVSQKNACINILEANRDRRAVPLALNEVSHLPPTLVSRNSSEL